jgi:hypothetical protein|tara:strand:- start:17155 stop:17859 length:705 start_codon:yes stop_codon:yes gene_type:complete
MMESELKNITHTLQKINVSKYEQSFETNSSHKINKTRYFKPREKAKQFVKTEKSSELSLVTTLFDIFSFEMDKSYILNKENFKLQFKKNIDDNYLKTICKQHKVLRNDLHTFIDVDEYIIPTNKNVLLYFANLMKTPLFIISDNQYTKCIVEEPCVEKITVIHRTNIKYYSSIFEAEEYLIKMNCIDSSLFDKKTKYCFIKNYVQEYKIMVPLIDCKTRESILNYLKKLYVIKN